MEIVERNQERQILQDLIKANIGLSRDRANALKIVFKIPQPNMTKEELLQNNLQRLEGMAEMALVRLNHAKSGSSSLGLAMKDRLSEQARAGSFGIDKYASVCEKNLDAKHTKRTIPELRIVSPEEDETEREEELRVTKRLCQPVVKQRSEPEPDANFGIYEGYVYPGGEHSYCDMAFPKR